MEIKYNEPIEVSQNQYGICIKKHHGICAFRKAEGKYFVKVLFMKYAIYVEEDLKNNQ